MCAVALLLFLLLLLLFSFFFYTILFLTPLIILFFTENRLHSICYKIYIYVRSVFFIYSIPFVQSVRSSFFFLLCVCTALAIFLLSIVLYCAGCMLKIEKNKRMSGRMRRNEEKKQRPSKQPQKKEEKLLQSEPN